MAALRHTGLYRKICELQTNYPIAAGAGFKDNYVGLYMGRGYFVFKGSGGRRLDSGEILIYAQSEVYIRFGSFEEIKKIKSKIRPDSKMKIKGIIYTIQTWEDISEKHFELHFTLNVQ